MAFMRSSKQPRFLGLLAFAVITGLSISHVPAQAQTASAVPLVSGAIDEMNLVRLAGQTHPLVSIGIDQGAVSDSMPMAHLRLQLQRSPEQEAQLSAAIQERQDPNSANYHHWFTAKELGEQFGPAQQDIETTSRWLSSHGFQVNGVSKNGLTMDISGTAGQVREAFHTEIHNYVLNGKTYIANASDPAIPAALKSLIVGVVALNNVMPKPAVTKPRSGFTNPCTGCPDGFNGITLYEESPADLAVIYNVNPLYEQKDPLTGKGQTVVVVEDTNIKPADVATFRKAFGLSKYKGTFTQLHPGPGCADPGINASEGEAALDAEWAGSVAPDADVVLVSCADTTTSYGGYTAAVNLLDSVNPPPIMSLSLISCEPSLGPAGNAFFYGLWQQAAGEGVSVIVSSGDGGAAGCDDFDTATFATQGIAANGLASTPWNLSAGGTDFLDTYENNISDYWNPANTSSGASAKSYVPEMPWNDSCGSTELYKEAGYTSSLDFCNSSIGSDFLNIVGGSGAPSFVYSKPYWQKGTVGIPNDGARDLPDVSLFASNGVWLHAILFCMSDVAQGGAPCDYTNPVDAFYNSAGGTSFTAPQLASIQALINQKAGGAQGNPAPIYYSLAKTEFGTSSKPNTTALAACNASKGNGISSACGFHDITVGNNAVPCYGKLNCYGSSAADYGVLSTSDRYFNEAYGSKVGWDFTSGLGSINVANIVKRWP
jgi:subtilase family serine protease